jgi:hypothetical protein
VALEVVPITQAEAKAFVAKLHRHTKPPLGMVFCVGVKDGETLVGVATAGRPSARMLQDGRTLEITRVCTDGARNACSMLYGASRRAAVALGYRRVVTYTLERESGASLRAAGFLVAGRTEAARTWGRRARVRYAQSLFGEPARDTGPKIRWEWQAT